MFTFHHRRSTLSALVLAAACAAPLAAADGGTDHAKTADHPAASKHACDCADKKGHAKAALKQRFDVDGDGRLDEEERAAAKAAVAEHRGERGDHKAKVVARFDANGDGHLDEAERATAKAALEKRQEQIRAKMLERFDADGDGSLDAEEKAKARAAVKRHRAHHGEQADCRGKPSGRAGEAGSRHDDHGVRDHGAGAGRDGRGRKDADLLGDR